MSITFNKSFTQQESIPEAGIDAAVELMRTGRLHRYNSVGSELSAAALLEQEYATWRLCYANRLAGDGSTSW